MTYLNDICDDLTTWKFDDIPVAAIATAKRALIDYFGVTIAGSQHPDVQGTARLASGNPGLATVLGTQVGAQPDYAALHNGFAAHIFDYDDFSIINHPTAPVAPAAFAVAEARHGSGAEVLRSYLLAGEIMYRIGRTCLPFTSDQGWHTTGVFGVLGASVAAALSAGRSTPEVAAALGIAASEASGLRGNFGSPVKAYHCGMAARTGIWCAELAGAGLQPSASILEGVDGFFQLFGGLEPNTISYPSSATWSILEPGFNFKRYACCSSMGPALDALLESEAVAALNAEDITAVHVGQSPWSFKELIYHSPTRAAETKFSMEYAVAAALTFRRADLEIFNDDSFLNNDQIRPLMEKVRPRVDEELARREFTSDAPVKIDIELRDGRSIHLSRDFAKGNVRDPLTDEQVVQKYRSLAAPVIGENRAESLLNGLRELENVEDVAALFRS
ncbi:MmgE/PrpD family protein [Microbacterium jejuense]|uniref:MmgE/PrpD family protein n=1 Tax=Microbacterium jejuense TaxID=1263637 RepID=A0ABS7HJD2_9MICO|nr:MmgE/PrpD family protein [Microbacterium jejuense]MBW9093049.1 MmgE/PrpD family protein [Microbacterium jejuense]